MPSTETELQYTVGKNQCGCHWQTCNCLPWAVFDGKDKMSTYFHEGTAQRVANSLNDSGKKVISNDG